MCNYMKDGGGEEWLSAVTAGIDRGQHENMKQPLVEARVASISYTKIELVKYLPDDTVPQEAFPKASQFVKRSVHPYGANRT